MTVWSCVILASQRSRQILIEFMTGRIIVQEFTNFSRSPLDSCHDTKSLDCLWASYHARHTISSMLRTTYEAYSAVGVGVGIRKLLFIWNMALDSGGLGIVYDQ